MQADDADSEFNQGPGSSDERLRLRARDEGDAVLDVGLAHDEFTQPFLRAGGVRSLSQRLPEFLRSEGVVLALVVVPVSSVTMASLAQMPAWIASPAATVGR